MMKYKEPLEPEDVLHLPSVKAVYLLGDEKDIVVIESVLNAGVSLVLTLGEIERIRSWAESRQGRYS